jgi:hypothetical protein
MQLILDIVFIYTNTNFLFLADHKQLRYEDCVMAQGALIQVQQGLGKYMAMEIARELGTELLVENKNLSNKREDRLELLVHTYFSVCRLAPILLDLLSMH